MQTSSDRAGQTRVRITVPWKSGLMAMKSDTFDRVDGQNLSAHCVFRPPWDQVRIGMGWLDLVEM